MHRRRKFFTAAVKFAVKGGVVRPQSARLTFRHANTVVDLLDPCVETVKDSRSSVHVESRIFNPTLSGLMFTSETTARAKQRRPALPWAVAAAG